MMSFTRSGGIVEKFCSTGTTPVPSVGSFSARLAGLAVHVVLADQRLRPDLAARVLAQVGEARLGDLRLDLGERAAVLLDDLEAGRLAGGDAADPEVALLDQAERVVEDDLVGGLVAAAVVGRAAAEDDGGRADADHEEDAEEPPHQSLALSSSLQLSASCSSAVSRFDLSGGPARREPGQRWKWPADVPPSVSVNTRWPRAVAPRASKPAPVVEKSSNQPKKSGVYGRPKRDLGRGVLERLRRLGQRAPRHADVDGAAARRGGALLRHDGEVGQLGELS